MKLKNISAIIEKLLLIDGKIDRPDFVKVLSFLNYKNLGKLSQNLHDSLVGIENISHENLIIASHYIEVIYEADYDELLKYDRNLFLRYFNQYHEDLHLAIMGKSHFVKPDVKLYQHDVNKIFDNKN